MYIHVYIHMKQPRSGASPVVGVYRICVFLSLYAPVRVVLSLHRLYCCDNVQKLPVHCTSDICEQYTVLRDSIRHLGRTRYTCAPTCACTSFSLIDT